MWSPFGFFKNKITDVDVAKVSERLAASSPKERREEMRRLLRGNVFIDMHTLFLCMEREAEKKDNEQRRQMYGLMGFACRAATDDIEKAFEACDYDAAAIMATDAMTAQMLLYVIARMNFYSIMATGDLKDAGRISAFYGLVYSVILDGAEEKRSGRKLGPDGVEADDYASWYMDAFMNYAQEMIPYAKKATFEQRTRLIATTFCQQMAKEIVARRISASGRAVFDLFNSYIRDIDPMLEEAGTRVVKEEVYMIRPRDNEETARGDAADAGADE